MDDLIKLATGGISSTSAMGEGVTEGILPHNLI
jgi:Isocitrate lyase family